MRIRIWIWIRLKTKNRHTDRLTDGQTDIVMYRVVTQLKTNGTKVVPKIPDSEAILDCSDGSVAGTEQVPPSPLN